MVEAFHGHLPLEAVLSPARVAVLEAGSPHGNAKSLVTRTDTPEGGVDAETYARALAMRPDVIRAKGHVETAQGLKTIQVVGMEWDVRDALRDAQVGVVIISLRDAGGPLRHGGPEGA